MLLKQNDSNRLSVNTTSSSNPSSTHSPSVTGEQFDVKVEITPPPPSTESMPIPSIPKSFSNESTSTLSAAASDYLPKTNTPSPQPKSQRKYSEIGDYGLLSAVSNMSRLNPSPTGSTASNRFFKRIEEMIDLSSPYNHYKCLSPSETNLTQYMDARSAFTHSRSDSLKPGSGRLLRRQFSLDKDDAAALQLSHRARQEANKVQQAARMHKQHSISTAQDLEKIEENPISPQNSQNNHNENNKTTSNTEKNELKLNVESFVVR